MGHPLGRALFDDPANTNPVTGTPHKPPAMVEPTHYGAASASERAVAARLGLSLPVYISHRKDGERFCIEARHWVPDAEFAISLSRCKPHAKERRRALRQQQKRGA